MSHQPTIEKKAAELHAALNSVGYSFDPTIFITIIQEILALFGGCNLTPAQAEKRAANPRLLDRFVVRRLVKKHASDEDEEPMRAALYDMGKETTTAEMSAMYAEMDTP